MLCLLAILFTATSLHAETFKIESFYYHTANNWGVTTIGNKIIFNTDKELSCEGMSSNKIFFHTIGRHINNRSNIPYKSWALTRFWPSTFFRSAALAGATIEADLGAYDPITDACEIKPKSIPDSYGSLTPQVFTPSEKVSGNFISKVYYQLGGALQETWVYADTSTEITCADGVTTNRVIPRLNGNGIYSSDDRSHGTQIFFGLLSGVVSSYKVGGYNSFRDGCIIEDIVFSPAIADGFTQDDLDYAFDSGVQVCKDNPSDCDLFGLNDLKQAKADGYNNGHADGLLDGEQNCKDNPTSCGLFTQSDVDNALAAGQALGVQQGIVQGVQQCIDDPSSCNLFDQQFVDNSITQIVNQIINELPKGQIISTCKKNPSSPLCQ